MPTLMQRRLILNGATTPAYNRNVLATSPQAYWPLTDTSGAPAVNASSGGASYNGTYTNGPVLADIAGPGASMGRAPKFDGVNDLVNVYSAALASAFNGTAGSMAAWFKVSGSGVYSDGTLRRMIYIGVDANNIVSLMRATVNNQLIAAYSAGGTLVTVRPTYSATTWTHFAMTWNKAADQFIAYLNGAQTLTTQTGLGTWAGTPGSNSMVLASADSVTPVAVWSGWLAHLALYTRIISAAEVLTLATAV